MRQEEVIQAFKDHGGTATAHKVEVTAENLTEQCPQTPVKGAQKMFPPQLYEQLRGTVTIE